MSATSRFVAGLLALSPAVASSQEIGTTPPQGAEQSFPDSGAASPGPLALPFTTTSDLRAATVARHVRELRITNPIAAIEVAREMAKHDYDAIFRSFLTDTELRADDAGDVVTAFIVLQWMVANNAKVEPSAAALRAIRRQMVEPLAGKPPLSQAATRAIFAEQVKLRTVLHHAGWQAAERLGTLPAFLAGLSKEFIPPAKLRSVALTDDGLAPKGGRTRSGGEGPPRPRADAPAGSPGPDIAAPPRPSEPLAEPRHAANWSAVEGVYFRSITGFGVGGMMVIEFEPLILFRDGTTYEIDDAALEDVDLSAERVAKPRRFGRWSRSGDSFVLTRAGGKPQDYTLQGGSFFKAYPADAGEGTIARGYRRVSGGGNSAMGGDVTIAVSNRYDFRADGTYTRGGSTGALNSGATSGAGSALSRRGAPEGGRYSLDRHTLTLIGSDGRSRRLFFAYGSKKDPPQPDREMAFIGGSVFSRPD